MKTIDDNKENVILVNKADLLTIEQRSAWAEFFEKENVKVIFWSALAEAIQLMANSKVMGTSRVGLQGGRFRFLLSVLCLFFLIVDLWGFISFFPK